MLLPDPSGHRDVALGLCQSAGRILLVLNVRSDNPPALAAYRRLGYQEHVRFEERLIHRLGPPWPAFGPLRRLFGHRENTAS